MDDLLSWFFAFLLLFFVLSLVGYQIVCLTDLEIDYINQYDAARRINKVVLPEFVSQGVLCFLYLATGCWFMFLLSLPYLCYNIRLWKRNRYLIDVTEIYNNLRQEKNRRLFKLYYLILLVVVAMFCVKEGDTDDSGHRSRVCCPDKSPAVMTVVSRSQCPSNAGFGLDQRKRGRRFLRDAPVALRITGDVRCISPAASRVLRVATKGSGLAGKKRLLLSFSDLYERR